MGGDVLLQRLNVVRQLKVEVAHVQVGQVDRICGPALVCVADVAAGGRIVGQLFRRSNPGLVQREQSPLAAGLRAACTLHQSLLGLVLGVGGAVELEHDASSAIPRSGAAPTLARPPSLKKRGVGLGRHQAVFHQDRLKLALELERLIQPLLLQAVSLAPAARWLLRLRARPHVQTQRAHRCKRPDSWKIVVVVADSHTRTCVALTEIHSSRTLSSVKGSPSLESNA